MRQSASAPTATALAVQEASPGAAATTDRPSCGRRAAAPATVLRLRSTGEYSPPRRERAARPALAFAAFHPRSSAAERSLGAYLERSPDPAFRPFAHRQATPAISRSSG